LWNPGDRDSVRTQAHSEGDALDVTIKHQFAFSLAMVKRAANEQITAASGRLSGARWGFMMYRHTGHHFPPVRRVEARRTPMVTPW